MFSFLQVANQPYPITVVWSPPYLFDISISNIDCWYIDTFEKYRYRYGHFENINIDIDKANLENIDIDKAILENIDIDMAIMKNINMDIDWKSLRNIDIDIDIDKGIIKISIW